MRLPELPLQNQATKFVDHLRASNERLAPYERRALEAASGLSTAIVASGLYHLTHEPLWAGIFASAFGLAESFAVPEMIRMIERGSETLHTLPQVFIEKVRSVLPKAARNSSRRSPEIPRDTEPERNSSVIELSENQRFVVELLKRMVEFNGEKPESLNINTLSEALRESYLEHMAPGNNNFDPSWGVEIMPDVMSAVEYLQYREGVKISHNGEDNRVADQILVASAMQAIDDARAQSPKALSSDQTEAIGKAEMKLREVGMKRLVEIGVLEKLPHVDPLEPIQDEEDENIYTLPSGPRIFPVTYTSQFATLVRDFHIESATSRAGLSPLLSGELDTDPTKKIILVAGTSQKEDLFAGLDGSDVYKYTRPAEINIIKRMVENEIRKDKNFRFKKVVSLSMGAKYAGANHNWLADMEPYLKQQIADGGVFLIGSTDSNLAGPLLTRIKQLGGKTIGVVPEGPVVFPGYSQDNLNYQYPSAALPADITIVVQAGREYNGSESPYFVQIALTEALAEGRMLDIGMINGGKLTLLDEVARLLDAEARKPRKDFPELRSNLLLVKDAGRGSQLLSVLVQRKRNREGTGQETTVEELVIDMEASISEDCDPEQRSKLLEEFGYREDDPEAITKIRAFLKELKNKEIPFAVALTAAFRAYNEYIERHQLADAAVQVVTTSQLKARYS